MAASKPPPSRSASVLLVDEDALFRHGIRELLEGDGFEICGEVDRADEAVRQALEARPDVILVAVWMRPSGIAVTARICQSIPDARVVMLTNSSDPADAEAAIRAGACGYVLKDDSPQEIADAVRAGVAGGSPLSPRIAAGLLRNLSAKPSANGAGVDLTDRELRVLELLAAGRRNSEIASELAISIYTVKRHVSNLFAKLEVENRTQAAVEAARRGLI